MTSPSADTNLAQVIEAAIACAEKHAKHEGFMPYPFIVGHILGNLPADQIDAFDARLNALPSGAKP